MPLSKKQELTTKSTPAKTERTERQRSPESKIALLTGAFIVTAVLGFLLGAQYGSNNAQRNDVPYMRFKSLRHQQKQNNDVPSFFFDDEMNQR